MAEYNFRSVETEREQRLRMFGNRALRRIFGRERWRKLHNEELHDLHYSPSIIRIMK
jgi:hypothetical protein